jgi:hypothetical protein
MGESRGGHTIGGQTAAHLGNLKTLLQFIGGTGSEIDVDMVDGRHVDDSKKDTNSLWTAAQIVKYVNSENANTLASASIGETEALTKYPIGITVMRTGGWYRGYGTVITFRNPDNTGHQLFFRTDANNHEMWTRYYNSSGWTEWAKNETTDGAQAKANQAETNAKNASVPRTGGTMTGALTVKGFTNSDYIGYLASNNGKNVVVGVGGADVYIRNSVAGMNLQLRDDGKLHYNNQEIETTSGAQARVNTHANLRNNPHNVTSEQVNVIERYTKLIDDTPSTYPMGHSITFVRIEDGWDSYGTVSTMRGYSSGGATWQTYVPYSPNLGGTKLKYRIAEYKDGVGVWGEWQKISTEAYTESYTNAHANRKDNPHNVTPEQVTSIGAKPGTDNANTYPVGVTTFAITELAGYPSGYGTVITTRYNNSRGGQQFFDKEGDVWSRTMHEAMTNGWSPWGKQWSSRNFNPDSKLNVGATATAASKLATARTIAVNSAAGNASVSFDGSSNVTLSLGNSINFGAGQDLPLGTMNWGDPSQGISWSADTDAFHLFMRTEQGSGEQSALVMQLGDNTSDSFDIEANTGGGNMEKLFSISRSAGARFNNDIFMSNGKKVATEEYTQARANSIQNWAEGHGLGSAGTDKNWNDIRTSGFYRGATNGPYGGTMVFGFHSQHSTNYATQIVGRNGRIFQRTLENNTWESWQELETSKDATAKANQAETNAKNASVAITGDTMTGTLILNNNVNLSHKLTNGDVNRSIHRGSDNNLYLNADQTGAVIMGGSAPKLMNGQTLETTTGAQSKADSAKDTAIGFAQEYGIGSSAKNISADLNSMKTGGFYRFDRNNASVTNNPPIGSGEHSWVFMHILEHSSTYIVQHIWDFNAVSQYTRALVNGSWNAWKAWSTESDAQARANAAEAAAEAASLPRSGGTISGTLTVNSTSYLKGGAKLDAMNSGLELYTVSSSSSNFYKTSGTWLVGGKDTAGLNGGLNNFAVQTWYGFSISPTITGQAVAQGTPAFSVNARNGDVWAAGDIYMNKDQRVSTQNDAQARANEIRTWARNLGFGESSKATVSSLNLDTLLINGFYYVQGGTNTPGKNSNYGYLICQFHPTNDQHGQQYYRSHDSDTIYYRRRSSGVWQSWQTIANYTPDVSWRSVSWASGKSGTLKYAVLNNVIYFQGAWRNDGTTGTICSVPYAPEQFFRVAASTTGSWGSARISWNLDGTINMEGINTNNNENVSYIDISFSSADFKTL